MGQGNSSITDVKQWDIWWVYWPHEDGEPGDGKGRPALAISLPGDNAARGYVEFVKITSQNRSDVPLRLAIMPTDQHFRHTGLTKPSWIHYSEEWQIPRERPRLSDGNDQQHHGCILQTSVRNLEEHAG